MARVVRAWKQCADLDCVRTSAALSRLPEAERKAWQNLWGQVKTLASGDSVGGLEQARHNLERKRWADAAEIYLRFPNATSPLRGCCRAWASQSRQRKASSKD